MASTYELIASQTLGSSASSVTFSSIPGTYTDLLLVCSTRTDLTGANWSDLEVIPNSATTSLSSRVLYGTGSSAGSLTSSTAILAYGVSNSATSSTFGNLEIYVPNYSGSTNKSVSITSASESNAASALIGATAGLWSSTSAITSLGLKVSGGTGQFVTGSSFQLFGVTHA